MGEELRLHGVGPSKRRSAEAAIPGGGARPPEKTTGNSTDGSGVTARESSDRNYADRDAHREALLIAASARHRRHLDAVADDGERRRVLPMITGGIGTIMVLLGLLMASQLSPPTVPDVEVLAGQIQDPISASTTSEIVDQPLGPIASSTTATTAAPIEETTDTTDTTPATTVRRSPATSAALPSDPGPVSLDSTTTTTIVTETPSTTLAGPEIGSPTSTTTIAGLPEAPSTTQAPTVPVTTAPAPTTTTTPTTTSTTTPTTTSTSTTTPTNGSSTTIIPTTTIASQQPTTTIAAGG